MSTKTVLWTAGIALVVFLVAPPFIAFVKNAMNKVQAARMTAASPDQGR